MAQRDQEARKIFKQPAGTDGSVANQGLAYLASVDTANLQRLKQIIRELGFPTVDMVGMQGVHAAWLLTQHADSDPAFQARMLKVIANRVRQGELNGQEYALLTDRVRLAQGKLQLYGTQFEERDGEWKPRPIADQAHVDERRRIIGMGSLAGYSCILRVLYGPADGSPR